VDRDRIGQAWCCCLEHAGRHYENFPVASRLLPARLRGPVAAIYLFARHADDLADEGSIAAAERLERLADWGVWFERAVGGDHEPPAGGCECGELLAIALQETVNSFTLPRAPFHRLIDAFAQDVVQRRYHDRRELLDYCRRSANPVGELMLHLNGAASERNLADSDAICTALQLINFLQDIQQDYHELGRIYLPASSLAEHGVDESMIASGRDTPQLRRLLQSELLVAERLLLSGAPLGRRLGGRFGIEIRAIVAGGLAVCRRLSTAPPGGRPRLAGSDRLQIAAAALLPPLWRFSL
jgi:squalene synthase HpnC